MTTFVWRPIELDDDGEPTKHGWVEKSKKAYRGVMTSVYEEVIAPDGTRIASSSQMNDFTNRTGLTNSLDSIRAQTQAEIKRAAAAKSPGTKKERVAAIRDSIERASSSGYHRRVNYDE